MRVLFNFFRKLNSDAPIVYGVFSIGSSLLTMLAGIASIKWISPQQLGVWQTISILQLYIPFFELGIPNGLNRELPFAYGKGESKRALALAATSQYFMTAISIALLLVTFVALGVMFIMEVKTITAVSCGAVGLLLAINAYQRYLTVTYRSNHSFLALGRLYFYQCILQVILLPMIWKFQYYGLLAYSLMVAGTLTGMMHLGRPLRVESIFNRELLKELAKVGLPVFTMNYLRGVATSFNRLILLTRGGVGVVGLFSPVSAMGAFSTVVPGIISNFIFPKMNYDLGATNNPARLWPLVLKINTFLALASIPLVVIIWLSVPRVIQTYFEDYKSSTFAIQLFGLNFLFSGMLVSHNVIYALKQSAIGFVYVCIELVLRAFVPFAFVYLSNDDMLSAVVYGTLLSNLILYILNLYFIRIAISKWR